MDYDHKQQNGAVKCMEEIGAVSLWLGKTGSFESLESILQVSYSEEGDFEGSPFTKGFNIRFYDEGCREAEFLEESYDSLETLLEGFSYDNIIIPKFSALVDSLTQQFNTVVLLYNFRYIGSIWEWNNQLGSLNFFGSVSYIN
jgi:hypothetical protein